MAEKPPVSGFPLLEIEGTKVLEMIDRIWGVVEGEDPAVVCGAMILMAYGILSGREFSEEEAQRVIYEFAMLISREQKDG